MLALVRMFITIHTIHIWPCDPCVPLPRPWRWWGVGSHKCPVLACVTSPSQHPQQHNPSPPSTPSERTGRKWKMCSNNLWIQQIWYTNNHCNFWIKRLSLFKFHYYFDDCTKEWYLLYVRARHVLKGTYRTLLKYSFLKTDRRATEVHKRERLDEKFENPLKTNKQKKKGKKKKEWAGVGVSATRLHLNVARTKPDWCVLGGAHVGTLSCGNGPYSLSTQTERCH